MLTLSVDNNYICFGTKSKDDCQNNPDKYMYRIIGIDKDNHLKLIKENRLIENNVDKFVLDTKSSAADCEGTKCDWPNTLLYRRINGLSNGSTSGSGSNKVGDTNIFVNNNYYPYMNKESNWYNLIEDHEWYYGDIDHSIASTSLNNEIVYGSQNNGLIIYQIETGQLPTQHYEYINNSWTYVKYQWDKNKITAKIGLMYLHDYYLAYDNETNWYYKYDTNNWAYSSSDGEWLMSRYGYQGTWNDYRGYAVYPKGYVFMTNPIGYDQIAVRPVFYVKNTIKLNGTGTEDDPYIIMQKDEEGKYYYDYEYTGDVQTFTVPEDGTYKIELWGASGGDKDQYKGGNGAYTSGLITLSQNSKLYIYVGGAGSETDYGGYNGGGDLITNQLWFGSSGGGATDVRLESGVWNNFTSLKSRIMVAAGGGGANNRNISLDEYWYGAGNGGSGGGLTGYDGESPDSTHTNPTTGKTYGWGYGTGGAQTEGGYQIFSDNWQDKQYAGQRSLSGYFGYCKNNQSGCGGGYYAGSGGGHAGAGGGSSYISGHNGCRAITQNSTENSITHSESSIHYSNMEFKETVMIDGNGYSWTDKKGSLINQPSPHGGTQTGNVGNGYARITKID